MNKIVKMKRYNIDVKVRDYWMKYTDCYFIDSLDSYKDYMTELNNKFLVSESEIKNIKTFIGHGHSFLTGLSGLFCGMINEKEKREPMLAHLKYIQATILSNQIKLLLDGNKLVINKNGGYFPINLDQEYNINEIGGERYTEKDIKINKWWGGNHYYAKVGNIDVIDDNGNIVKEDIHDIERRKYYNNKYQGRISNVNIEFSDEINKLYNSYSNYSGEDKNERTRLYSVYRDAADEYLYQNHDLTPTFIEICKNSVVCPYMFSDCTVKGSEYENAGEIYMVVTDDTVYFEIERHY